MKNKRKKLTLDEVETQMEVLTKEEINQLKGGYHFQTGSSIDVFSGGGMGSWYNYDGESNGLLGGSGTDDDPFLLSEVVVTSSSGGGGGNPSNFGWSIFYTGGNWQNSYNEPSTYGPPAPLGNDYGNPYTGDGNSVGGGYPYTGVGGTYIRNKNGSQNDPYSKHTEYQRENDRDFFLKKMFGSTSFFVDDRDWGAIGSNTFNNPHSANGAVIHRIITDSKMGINLSPVLNRNNGDYSVENLQGIKFNIVISGDTIAPYQGVDIRLSPIRMTVNGKEIKPTQYQTPQFIQGGSVPSIPFEMFIDSTYLKDIANTTRKMIIEFEGIYVDRNGNTIMCDPVVNVLPNKVNLKVEIPIHKF